MTNVVRLRIAPTRAKALEIIRESVVSTKLGWSYHGAFDKMYEADITAPQVLRVLSEAEIVDGPTWSEEHEDWVCILRKQVAGRSVSVVVGIDQETAGVTVVTVF